MKKKRKTGLLIAAALIAFVLAAGGMTAVKYRSASQWGAGLAQALQGGQERFEQLILLIREMNTAAADGGVTESRMEDYRDFCGMDEVRKLRETGLSNQAAHRAELYNALGGSADPALCMAAEEYAGVRAAYYHPMMALEAKLLEDEAQFGSELKLLSSLLEDTLAADEAAGTLLVHRALRRSFGFENLRSGKRFAALRENMTQEERYTLLCLSDVTLEELYLLRAKELGRCEARLEDCYNRIVRIQEFDLPAPLAEQRVNNMITYAHESVSGETMNAGMDAIWR